MMSPWLDSFRSRVQCLVEICTEEETLSAADELEILGLGRHMLHKLLPTLTANRYKVKYIVLKETCDTEQSYLTLDTFIEQLQSGLSTTQKVGYSSPVIRFLQSSARVVDLAHQVQQERIGVAEAAKALRSLQLILSAALTTASKNRLGIHMVLLIDTSKPVKDKCFVPLDLILEQREKGFHMETEILVKVTVCYVEGSPISMASVVQTRTERDADSYIFSKAYNTGCHDVSLNDTGTDSHYVIQNKSLTERIGSSDSKRKADDDDSDVGGKRRRSSSAAVSDDDVITSGIRTQINDNEHPLGFLKPSSKKTPKYQKEDCAEDCGYEKKSKACNEPVIESEAVDSFWDVIDEPAGVEGGNKADKSNDGQSAQQMKHQPTEPSISPSSTGKALPDHSSHVQEENMTSLTERLEGVASQGPITSEVHTSAAVTAEGYGDLAGQQLVDVDQAACQSYSLDNEDLGLESSDTEPCQDKSSFTDSSSSEEKKTSSFNVKKKLPTKPYPTRSQDVKLEKNSTFERAKDVTGKLECFDVIGKVVRNRRHLQFKQYICYMCETGEEFGSCSDLCTHIRSRHFKYESGCWYLYCLHCTNRYSTKSKRFNSPWGIMDTLTSHFTHMVSMHALDIPQYLDRFTCDRCMFNTAIPEFIHKHLKRCDNMSLSEIKLEQIKSEPISSSSDEHDMFAMPPTKAPHSGDEDVLTSISTVEDPNYFTWDENSDDPRVYLNSERVTKETIAPVKIKLTKEKLNTTKDQGDESTLGYHGQSLSLGMADSANQLFESEDEMNSNISYESSSEASNNSSQPTTPSKPQQTAKLQPLPIVSTDKKPSKTSLGSVQGCFRQYWCYLCSDERTHYETLEALVLHCRDNHLRHRINIKTTHAALKCPRCRYTTCLLSTNLKTKEDLLEMLAFLTDHMVLEHNFHWVGFRVRLYCRQIGCSFIGSTLKAVIEHERKEHLGMSKTRAQRVRTLTLLTNYKYVTSSHLNTLYQL